MVLGYLKVSSFQPKILNGASLKNISKETNIIKIAKGNYFFASHPFLPHGSPLAILPLHLIS
jgi:hypothetical protein